MKYIPELDTIRFLWEYQIFQTEGVSFVTMALAGTQIIKKDTVPYWNIKELNEQKIVVDAITNSLKKLTSVLRISEKGFLTPRSKIDSPLFTWV